MHANMSIDLEHDVLLAQAGNQQAYERIVRKTSNAIGSISLAITKDLSASEDVTQQVFLKAWQELSKLKNPKSVLPWLRQITRYTAFNYLRTNKRSQSLVVQSDQDIDYDELLDQVCNEANHTDEALIKQQQTILIQRLLSQLDPESHEIILLYYREEQNSQNVAELLDLTPSNVRKKLERARQILKKQVLQQYGQVVYSSAPAGLVAVIMGMLAHGAPLSSAGISVTSIATSSAKSSATGFAAFSKYFTFAGAFFISTIIGLMANHFSMKAVIKQIESIETQHALNKVKSETAVYIIVASVIMAIGYIITSGWLVPSLGFLVLAYGLIRSTRIVLRLTEGVKIKNCVGNTQYGYLGLTLGLIGGGAGLVIGLYQSGRFAQFW